MITKLKICILMYNTDYTEQILSALILRHEVASVKEFSLFSYSSILYFSG